MLWAVAIHPQAEREYHEACQWYEKRLNGLGVRFEEAIGKTVGYISSNPLQFPKKTGAYR